MPARLSALVLVGWSGNFDDANGSSLAAACGQDLVVGKPLAETFEEDLLRVLAKYYTPRDAPPPTATTKGGERGSDTYTTYTASSASTEEPDTTSP